MSWWVLVPPVLVAVSGIVILLVVRPASAMASWGPSASPGDAITRALLNSYDGHAAIAVSVAAALGVAATFVRRRHRWLSVSLLLLLTLYVCTATLPRGILRYRITDTWYSDVWRLVALTPVALVPLGVIGVMWVADLFAGAVRRGASPRLARPGRGALAGVVAGLVLVAALGTLAQSGPSMTAMDGWTRLQYRLGASSPLLSSDERALLERVPSEVAPDAVVIGDPWTGTSLVWALADRRALVPHIYGTRSAATALLLQHLRDARPGDAVCRAVHREHVTYALDFGANGVFGATDRYPGVHRLDGSAVATLVDRVGEARLYEITGCR